MSSSTPSSHDPVGDSEYSESDMSDYSDEEEVKVEEEKPPTYPWPDGPPSSFDQVEGLVKGRYRLIDLIPKPWLDALGVDHVSSLLTHVQRGLVDSLKRDTVYPQPSDYFAALAMPPEEVRVVILGQNPYHGPRQAHGLAFSDNSGKMAPSLRNMCEVIRKNGYSCPSAEGERKDGRPRGNLSHWVDQGVLLLNSSLTVIRGNASSHMDIGWQAFTDQIISYLARSKPLKAFCLWGGPAQEKKRLISGSQKHLILTTSHPSPLSWTRGFRDCTHFREVNDFLEGHGRSHVDWNISYEK